MSIANITPKDDWPLLLKDKVSRLAILDRRYEYENNFSLFLEQAWPSMDGSPYQKSWVLPALCDHLEAVTTGHIKRLLVNLPPRCGKPVCEDEWVVERARGRIRLADIKVGDLILTHRGRFRRVAEVHLQGILPITKIETWSGRVVRAAADHPFLTTEGWKEVRELLVGDSLGLVSPLENCGSETLRPEEARLLGYLIGDGSIAQGQPGVTTASVGVSDDVKACAAAMGWHTRESSTQSNAWLVVIKQHAGTTRGPNKSGWRQWLEYHRLYGTTSYTKRVPLAVMGASKEIIAEFLGAYWSCDGHITGRGKRGDGRERGDCVVGCDSVSRDLMLDVQHLLLRLGIFSRIRQRRAKIKTKRQGDEYISWSLTLSRTDDVAKFAKRIKLAHEKRVRLESLVHRTDFDRALTADQITYIEPCGTAVCRCLTVEDDASFTAADFAVHNSLTTSIAWPAWIWAREQQTFVSGPGVKLLTASYGAHLSLDHSNKTRQLILSPWYQTHWADRFSLRQDTNSKSQFANTKGGERQATSVGGSLLGLGGMILTVDDAHNVETEKKIETDADRRRVASWWKELHSTRLNDPKQGAIVVIMQRLHQCLVKGTPVRVPSGEAKIESLKVGDQVYGSNGWQQISHVGSRRYKGFSYGVRVCGHYITSWTTNNHLYLTKRGWVRADELKKADWVCLPILKQKETLDVPWEPVKWAPPPRAPTGNAKANHKRQTTINEAELRELIARGLTNCEIAKLLGVHRNTIHNSMFFYRINRMMDRNPIFGVAHLDDPDFWRVVGLWIAEGSFCLGRGKICGIRFTFGSHEPHFVAFVRKIMGRYGVSSYGKVPHPSCLEASLFCSQLARWLCKHFGRGAHNKRLPSFAFSLPEAYRRQILEGWLDGDGCVRQDGARRGSTVSVALVHDMQRLALGLGLRCFIYKSRSYETIINGQKVTPCGYQFELRFAWPRHKNAVAPQRSIIDGGFLWSKVASIKKEPYNGKVYDITTPSHDFVVGNSTVHNSDLSGIILDSDEEWVHMCVPMSFDERRRSVTVVLPQYDDPEPWQDPRTYDGELMWPERFDEKEVRKLEHQLGPYLSAGRLQQMPVPKGGGIIKRDWWQLWDKDAAALYGLEWNPNLKEFPHFELVYASIDTAYGEKDENNYNAMTVWGVWLDRNKNRRLMLMFGWVKRLPLHGRVIAQKLGEAKINFKQRQQAEWGLVELIADTCKRYKVQRLLIENKTRGHDVANELARLYARDNWGVEMINPVKDKVSRVHSIVPLFTDNMIWAPETRWSDEIISQVEVFPKGEFDDAVDSCVAGDTGIITSNGVIPISEIKVGDSVLTHKGRFCKVLRTSSRISDHYYNLKARGLELIQITGEHPAYVMTVICPATSEKLCGGFGWTPVRDLAPRLRYTFLREGKTVNSQKRGNHDALVIPRFKASPRNNAFIDLASFWGEEVKRDEKKIYRAFRSKGRFTKENVSKIKLLCKTIEQKEVAKMFGVSTAMISLLVNDHIGPSRRAPAYATAPRYIELNAETGWVMGLFAAEGCVSRHNIIWACDKNGLEKVRKWANRTFDKNLLIRKGVGCYKTVLSSTLAVPLFEEFGYLAENKIVPQWAMCAPPDFIRGFVDGYVYGDGNHYKNRTVMTSTSRSLLWGIRLMLSQLGKPAWLNISREAGPRKVFGKISNCLRAYSLDYLEAPSRQAIVSDEYIGTHIERLERVNEPITVYNLSVDEDESYVTVGGTFHNCSQAINWARENGIVERADETSASLRDEMTYKGHRESVAQDYGVG